MTKDLAVRVANIVEMAWIRQKEYLEDLIRNDPTLSESECNAALKELESIQFSHDNRKALREYLQDDRNRDVTETLNTVFQPFVIDQQPSDLPVNDPNIVVEPQSPRPFGRSNTGPIHAAEHDNKPSLRRIQTVPFSSDTRVTSSVAQAYLGSPIINASHLSWLYARFNAYNVTNEMVMAVVEALPNPTNTLEYQVEEGRTHLMMYHQVLQAVDENRALLESQLSEPSTDVLSKTQALLGGKVPGFTSLPVSSKAFAALLAVDYAKECKGYTVEKVKPEKRLQVLDRHRVIEHKRLINKLLLKIKAFVRQAHQRRLSQRRRRTSESRLNARMMVSAAARVFVARKAAVNLTPFLMRAPSLTR